MSAATTVRNFTDATITANDDAGHSHSVPLLIGTISWSGLKPAGKEGVRYEAQGAMTGHRLEARAYPSVSISAQVARMDDDFYQLLMGTLAAYVSTTADIGDAKCCDLQIDETYSTDARISLWDDASLDEWSYEAGSPGTLSMTLSVGGPVVIDGVTYISAR